MLILIIMALSAPLIVTAPAWKEFLANFLKDKPNLSGTKEEYDMAIGACDTRQLKGTCKGCDCIEDCYANRYKPI